MKRKLELMAKSLDLVPIPKSIVTYGHCVFAAATLHQTDVWIAAAAMRRNFPEGLKGELHSSRLGFLLVMPYSPENITVMRRIFPWAVPVSLRDEPMVWSVSPEYAECGPLSGPPVLRLPASPEEAASCLNRWNQAQFQNHRPIRFATEYRGPDPEAALASCASRFVWEVQVPSLSHTPSEPRGDLWEEYAEQRFILDGAVLHFSEETTTLCINCYAEILRRAGRFRNQVRRLRGDDFLLSLRLPPLPPEQETLHFFYLLRELRKRGWYAPGLAPRQSQLTAGLLAIVRLDACPLIWDQVEPPQSLPQDHPCQIRLEENGK